MMRDDYDNYRNYYNYCDYRDYHDYVGYDCKSSPRGKPDPIKSDQKRSKIITQNEQFWVKYKHLATGSETGKI